MTSCPNGRTRGRVCAPLPRIKSGAVDPTKESHPRDAETKDAHVQTDEGENQTGEELNSTHRQFYPPLLEVNHSQRHSRRGGEVDEIRQPGPEEDVLESPQLKLVF